MKLAIIGANGNLGTRITKQALDRGHQVKAFIYDGPAPDSRSITIQKNLFDLTRADVEDCQTVISAYGSGFHNDPQLNLRAYQKYIALCDGQDIHLIAIGGAGSLYPDEKHEAYCYEMTGYSTKLKPISHNIKLGIEELKKTKDVRWTVVCPSEKFDATGPFTKEYLVGTKGELIFNEDGHSYLTYDDMAQAMLDIAESTSYLKQMITVATKHGPQEKKDGV